MSVIIRVLSVAVGSDSVDRKRFGKGEEEREMIEEIIKTKKYARPQLLFCGSCPHCISFMQYGDCEQHYCLVDDEYKFGEYPEEKDCPFVKQMEEK